MSAARFEKLKVRAAWRTETADGLPREMVHGELTYLVPMRERAYRHEEAVPRGVMATNMR
jgi:hypothetical protein